MTNASRANAQAMPINRRAMLGRIAGAVALAVPAVAAASTSDGDAEIVALCAEIVRRCAEAEAFQETRIYVHQERFEALMFDPAKSVTDRWNQAWAFSRESGHTAAITELNEFDIATDGLHARLMAIPAATPQGRAAKVRAFLIHVARSKWRGPSKELDYDIDMARALLGEFAGMSADELAAI